MQTTKQTTQKTSMQTSMQIFICIIVLLLSACDKQVSHLALGTLERERIAHTATVNEVIVALPVSQGSIVDKGEILVKLDDTLQTAQIKKAEAQVAQAKANFEKLRNGARSEELAAARATVAANKAIVIESEANYLRATDLIKRKAISKAEVDKYLASRDSSLANLQNSTEILRKLSNGTREEDLRVAQASLDESLAILASEKKKLQDLTILATRDGILDNLPWNLGERVTTGSPLAIVLAGKSPYARVYVPEPYRVKLKIGDALKVHIDGLDTPIIGTLKWISSDPAFTPYYALNQEERSRLMYLAEVQLPESESNLPNGLPAQVEMP